MKKTYRELSRLDTFEERFEYLKLNGQVGESTFGWDRWINQNFYHRSPEWRSIRNQIIIRDNGCDLGVEGYEIVGRILIHHINPITMEDIETLSPMLLDPENLICVTHDTHNAIHYSDSSLLRRAPVERTPYDTCPWRNQNGR